MSWTLTHIEQLKAKGQIRGFVDKKPRKKEAKIRAKDKVSYEKLFIDAYLISYCQEHGVELYRELKFAEDRKFRFDWAIKELMIAVEYEGIFSKKSRHTTQSGYSKDTEKYNLAASLGWQVYRYTAGTYKNIVIDLNIKDHIYY